MQTGRVEFFDKSKGFGFIKINDFNNEAMVFVKKSEIKGKIKKDDNVAFDLAEGLNGLNAINVILNQTKKNNLNENELTNLYAHGREVFENNDIFISWLLKPNGALNGEIPANILDSAEGIELINNILGRIEHGIFS